MKLQSCLPSAGQRLAQGRPRQLVTTQTRTAVSAGTKRRFSSPLHSLDVTIIASESSKLHVAATTSATSLPAAAAAAAAATSSEADLRSCAVALAKVADDTKALDISVLHVEPLVSWTSYMVLCTVMSKPQLLAVLARMEDAAAELGMEKQNSAGSSQWEVLDFGSIVVHVFTADQREYYNLDDFYALADEVELPFVTASASVPGAGSAGYDLDLDAENSISGAAGLWSKSI